MFGKKDKKKENAKPAASAIKEGDTKSMASDDKKAQSPAAAAPAAAAAQRPGANFRYIDRPECAETFADTISGLAFDGQTLRIEFAVSRLDEAKPNTPLVGRRYPACRLVLPPAAAVDLMNKMQQVAAALTQAGYLKAQPRQGAETGGKDKLS